MALKKKAAAPAKSERRQTLAEIWDNTDSSEASNNLPAGEHEVRINGIELKTDAKKGDAAIITYEAIDGDYEGKTLRQLYKLRDTAGNKGPGAAYLMRDLEMLGYKEIDGKKLPKVLKEISDEQPMAVIMAKENGQYMNAYLQGTPEDVGGKGDEEEEEEVELEVGDEVTDGEVTGTIKKINKKKGTATVVDEDDEEHTLDLEDLSKADADEEEEEEEEEENPVKKGKKKAPVEKEEEEEEEEEEEPAPKAKKGKKAPVEEEEEEEEKEEEEDDISKGDTVTWEDEDGDELEGKVLSVAGTKVVVKDDEGDKHTVKLKDLTKV